MEIIMIKKQGCNPCKLFEPQVKSVAEDNQLKFKIIQAEEMPLNIRPEIFPYFYLRKGNTILEQWPGTNSRKLTSVLKRHIKNLIINI